MKKFFVLGLALAASLAATAQDDSDIVSEDANDVATNKKGQVITPQSGDIGLMLNAQPVLSFALDAVSLNNGGAVAPAGLNSPDGVTLQGRYFLDDATSFRGILDITKFGAVTKAFVDDASTAEAGIMVTDVAKVRATAVTIGGVYEMRRGYGRLQGYYGPMAMITVNGGGTVNEWGNSLADDVDNNFAAATRVKTIKNGSSIGLGLGAVLGAEYFFARKMSVGAEVSWGLQLNTVATGETLTETYDAVAKTTTETTAEAYGAAQASGFFSLPGSNVFLSLYF